jgi:endonuclease/exonuclease/phosphatase (EEP) superfamily protein YafD
MFAPRWVLLLPLAVLLPAAAIRARPALVPLAAATVVAAFASGFNLPVLQVITPAPVGTPFRVMTLSMHYSEADSPRLDALIAETAPDVVAVQEWPGAHRSALNGAPGWHVRETPRLFLASRHPVLWATDLGARPADGPLVAAHYELDTPAGTVHLFSLHASSNRQGISDALKRDPKAAAEVRANSGRRWAQSAAVAGRAAGCGGPAVVVGDFNAPPESAVFPEVWGRYTDAFAAAGWGWGYTYYGDRTAVRIDHVLAGPGWRVLRCRVGPDVGSAHRPVIADLIRTKE